MKFLFVGRTKTGKSLIRNILENKCKWIFANVYVTTDKHNSDFVYVPREQSFDVKDKLAVTQLNGTEYFMKKSDIATADAAVVEPEYIKDIITAFPDVNFRIIYIKAKSYNAQSAALLAGITDEEKQTEILKELTTKNSAEQFRYKTFETSLENQTFGDKNCVSYTVFENDYQNNTIVEFVTQIDAIRTRMNNMRAILMDLCTIKAIPYNETTRMIAGIYKTDKIDAEGKPIYKKSMGSIDSVTEQMDRSDALFVDTISKWLSLPYVDLTQMIDDCFNHVNLQVDLMAPAKHLIESEFSPYAVDLKISDIAETAAAKLSADYQFQLDMNMHIKQTLTDVINDALGIIPIQDDDNTEKK